MQYSEESVSRQVEMKAVFSEILAAALEHTPAADRLVLDTGDGAALCFLGDPEDALFAANSLRSGVLESPEQHGLRLRLGINLGPVRIVNDINGHSNVIGDGINVAQRVMSFAEPNQILVSRSYYEVVSRLAPDYAQLFQYVGLHRDKHVREHEVYEVQLAPPLGRAAAETVGQRPPPAADSSIHAPAAVEGHRALDPACIERLASALAREIGPVAKLIVRRAAERAAGEGALMDAVAEHVPAANRAGFLARRSDLLGTPRAAVGPPPVQATGAAGQPGSQGSRPDPEDRTRGPRPDRADADGPDRAGGGHPRAQGGQRGGESARSLRGPRRAHRRPRGPEGLSRRGRAALSRRRASVARRTTSAAAAARPV